MDKNTIEFIKNYKKLRRHAKNNKEIASALGITERQLYYYLKGKSKPSKIVLLLSERLLDVL